MNKMSNKGFTLIELIIVIVLLGILAVTAAPKFLSLSSDARIASLESVKASMQTSIDLVKVKGRIAGLTPLAENPGDSGQANFIINFGIGSAEVDFRNLCPESQGELGDALDMEDFLDLGDDLDVRSTNQYTLVGFDVPSSGTPTNQGCYILYDSFGFPDCTLTIVSDDC
jgi:MSHA pilin protein MshA